MLIPLREGGWKQKSRFKGGIVVIKLAAEGWRVNSASFFSLLEWLCLRRHIFGDRRCHIRLANVAVAATLLEWRLYPRIEMCWYTSCECMAA